MISGGFAPPTSRTSTREPSFPGKIVTEVTPLKGFYFAPRIITRLCAENPANPYIPDLRTCPDRSPQAAVPGPVRRIQRKVTTGRESGPGEIVHSGECSHGYAGGCCASRYSFHGFGSAAALRQWPYDQRLPRRVSARSKNPWKPSHVISLRGHIAASISSMPNCSMIPAPHRSCESHGKQNHVDFASP